MFLELLTIVIFNDQKVPSYHEAYVNLCAIQILEPSFKSGVSEIYFSRDNEDEKPTYIKGHAAHWAAKANKACR